MRTRSLLTSLLTTSWLLSCGARHDSTETSERQDEMAYNFWLTDPASAPIYVNPFSAGDAGTDVSTSVSSPYTANQCPSCTMTQAGDWNGVNNGHVGPWNGTTSYANSLWNYGGTGSLRSRLKAPTTLNGDPGTYPNINAPWSAGYASNLEETLNDYKDLLSLWPGVNPNTITTSKSVSTWARAYRPIETRALAAVGSTFYHPAPYALEEARYRGARTYCSMREAARQQDLNGHYTLGQEAGTDVMFWTANESESTVAVGKVYKDTSSPVANTFVVPIAIGSTLSPLKGLGIPTLGQVVHPVSWVTGDSVLISYENSGSEAWVNSQHADLFMGQKLVGSVSAPSLPLATWGFISLAGAMSLDVKYGVLLPLSGSTAPFSTNLNGGVGWAPLSLIPRTYTMDKLTGGHYRPWSVASDSEIATDPPFHVKEDDSYLLQFYSSGSPSLGEGTYRRLLTSDDRVVSVGDEANQSLGLTATGGFETPPGAFYLKLEISGSAALALTTQRITTLREQLSVVDGDKLLPTATVPLGYAYDNVVMQSNLVVIPETRHEASVDPLTIAAHVHIEMDFGLFDVEFDTDHTIYKAPTIPLPGVTKMGPESSRLRVGSFTDYGVEYFAPSVNTRSTYSHLPYPTVANEASVPSFASFPDAGLDSVGACLADTGVVPGNPPAPEPGLAGTPADAGLCVYGAGCLDLDAIGVADHCEDFLNLPSNICSPGVIASYVPSSGWTGASAACLGDALTFLCSAGTPAVQTWGSLGTVIARGPSSGSPPPSLSSEVAALQEACVNYFSPTTQEEADFAAAFADGLYRFGLCDSSHGLLGEPVTD